MSDVPAWLNNLVEVVAGGMEIAAPSGVGLQYRKGDGDWDVVLYPRPVELVGGPRDGELVSPPFSLNLEPIRSAFTRIDDFTWEAHPLQEEEGPGLSIEGQFAGRQVWLLVLGFTPKDVEAAARFYTEVPRVGL